MGRQVFLTMPSKMILRILHHLGPSQYACRVPNANVECFFPLDLMVKYLRLLFDSHI